LVFHPWIINILIKWRSKFCINKLLIKHTNTHLWPYVPLRNYRKWIHICSLQIMTVNNLIITWSRIIL
jgi:hypothetical protein